MAGVPMYGVHLSLENTNVEIEILAFHTQQLLLKIKDSLIKTFFHLKVGVGGGESRAIFFCIEVMRSV